MEYNFIEVAKNFDRMCKRYNSHCDLHECPVAMLIDEWEKEHSDIWIGSCMDIAKEKPEEFADYVMTWAEDNPELTYPTIGDVVRKICQLMNINCQKSNLYTLLENRLSKEVADYFNIKPINEERLV